MPAGALQLCARSSALQQGVCCAVPHSPPHPAAAVEVLSFRHYSSKGRGGLMSGGCMDLLFHLVFPLHYSWSVEELSTPSSSHPQPVGFQCWIPSSRDQTCSGVIYFSKYRYQLKGILCLCCAAEELGSVCSPGRAAHDPGEGSSGGSHSRRAWPRSVPVFARLMWGRAPVPAVILGWVLGAARP